MQLFIYLFSFCVHIRRCLLKILKLCYCSIVGFFSWVCLGRGFMSKREGKERVILEFGLKSLIQPHKTDL